MSKETQYKILSFTLFLIIFIITILILTKIENPDKIVYYSGGALILFTILLLVVNLLIISSKTDIIKLYQTQQNEEKEETDTENKVLKTELSESQKNEIIRTQTFELIKNTDTAENLNKFAEILLKNFANQFSIVQGIFFTLNKQTAKYTATATYAFYSNEKIREFELGEGISGQVAKNKETIIIDNVPDNYITILSGLGSGSPEYLLVAPIIQNETTIAIIELASFINLKETNIVQIIKNITPAISKKINELS